MGSKLFIYENISEIETLISFANRNELESIGLELCRLLALVTDRRSAFEQRHLRLVFNQNVKLRSNPIQD